MKTLPAEHVVKVGLVLPGGLEEAGAVLAVVFQELVAHMTLKPFPTFSRKSPLFVGTMTYKDIPHHQGFSFIKGSVAVPTRAQGG